MRGPGAAGLITDGDAGKQTPSAELPNRSVGAAARLQDDVGGKLIPDNREQRH